MPLSNSLIFRLGFALFLLAGAGSAVSACQKLNVRPGAGCHRGAPAADSTKTGKTNGGAG